MSDWVCEFKNSGGEATMVELHDTIGPWNSWTARDARAFVPKSGTFTNQTQYAVDTGGMWTLNNIDIDDLKPGTSHGTGSVITNNGDFGDGDITWRIVSAL